MLKIIMLAIAFMGLFTMGLAFNASHAIYVQAKVLKSEIIAKESMAKVDTLSRFSDQTFTLFEVAGGIQIALALIGLAIYLKPQRKESMHHSETRIPGYVASWRT
jgi:hypothetical protein